MTADSSTPTIWTDRATRRGRPDVVRVFEHDPDLLAGLDAATAEKLRRRAVARRLELPCLHRPTTSTALQRLVSAGRIARRSGRGWMLLGRPPAYEGEVDERATLAA